VTLKEAAALLGVTPDNLRQSIARGTFKAKKLGRDWITTQAEVTRYMNENRRVSGWRDIGKRL
jgi:excisionase family DNA binding protein